MFRSQEEILQEMLKNIQNTIDKSQNSLIHDALAPAAMEFANFTLQLEELRDKMDVENLEGEELERFVYQRTGITRKPATYATTIVIIRGQVGAKISKGDLIASDTVNFVSTEDKIIDSSGEITVLVECEQAGTIGNVPAGAINRFPVAITGLTSVTNLETVTNGYDAESDKELRQRYYERIRTPATSGNKYHYINWAKEVVGVGDARVVPLWNGDNTVKVIIIDSNKQPASDDLIEAVQEYIDPGGRGLGEGQAPIGAFCTVVSAMPKEINISVTISRDENYSLEQIQSAVVEGITNYLKEIAFKKNLVSYAKIGSIILDTDGVLDYTDLRVNEEIENIQIGDEEVAVLGEVVLSE